MRFGLKERILKNQYTKRLNQAISKPKVVVYASPGKLIGGAILTLLASAATSYGVYDHLKSNMPKPKVMAVQETNVETPEKRLEKILNDNNLVEAKDNNPIETAKPENKTEKTNIPLETLAGYIGKTYKGWTKKEMKSPEKYAGWIAKYAEQYEIDPYVLTALISHESRFANKDGDKNHYSKVNGKRTHNPAEGICQIGRTTQSTIRNLMRRKREKVSKANIDLKEDPELSVRMTAFYLAHLRDRNNGSIDEAIGHYNGGPGFMNPNYLAKVQEELEGVKAYFKKHKKVEVAGNF